MRGLVLIATVGDLAHQVESAALRRLGDQEGAKAVVKAKLTQMRRELGWGEASAVERLLIERVVQTWLQLQLLELADAQTLNQPMELDEYQQEKIVRAERRHLSAIKMLAQVRKMVLPLRIDLTGSLTVNAAKTRGNAAASASPGAIANINA